MGWSEGFRIYVCVDSAAGKDDQVSEKVGFEDW